LAKKITVYTISPIEVKGAKKIKKTVESKSKFHKESNQKTLHDV